MRKIMKLSLALVFLVAMGPLAGANGQVGPGDEAPLFDSIDENLNPVSMADMIDGKPLVLFCVSCS